MTEQEFLALPPREQDALVAEKVIGEKRYPREMWENVVLEHDGNGGISSKPLIRRFTRDCAAALEAFTMSCDPNRTSIVPCGNGSDGLWWAVMYDGVVMIASHREFAMALCIYALKARRVIE